MSLLKEIMDFNHSFVETKEFEQYRTDKFPDKRIVILSCMDTRLVELLPKAMNFKNGDVKIVKTAGAVMSHPFGGAMRSILVAVYELNADEVFVVGHHDCGMSSINVDVIKEKMQARNISPESLETLENAGIDFNTWLRGFDDVFESVKQSVKLIKNHPLIPKEICVHGLVISPDTGKLDVVVDGFEENKKRV